MKLHLATALTLLAIAPASADKRRDNAAALFEQGVKDLEAGDLERACAELSDSVDAWPDSGARGALAECLGARGKHLDAWRLWHDLATSAPSDELRAEAAKNAAALEPKLARVRIVATGAPSGLRVALDQAPATVGEATPVPAGHITVTATAPGHTAWTGSVDVGDGALAELAIPVAELRAIGPDLGRPRRLVGLGVAGGGVLVAGAGLLFGLRAGSAWDAALAACGGTASRCTAPDFDGARRRADDARRSATRANVFVGLGAAAIAAGVLVYLTAPRAGLHVEPALDRDGVGVSIGGAL